MGSIIVRPGSGDEGDPTFIPELSSEQKIPAEVWFTWMVIYVVAATVFTIWFGIRGIKLRLQPIAARYSMCVHTCACGSISPSRSITVLQH